VEACAWHGTHASRVELEGEGLGRGEGRGRRRRHPIVCLSWSQGSNPHHTLRPLSQRGQSTGHPPQGGPPPASAAPLAAPMCTASGGQGLRVQGARCPGSPILLGLRMGEPPGAGGHPLTHVGMEKASSWLAAPHRMASSSCPLASVAMWPSVGQAPMLTAGGRREGSCWGRREPQAGRQAPPCAVSHARLRAECGCQALPCAVSHARLRAECGCQALPCTVSHARLRAECGCQALPNCGEPRPFACGMGLPGAALRGEPRPFARGMWSKRPHGPTLLRVALVQQAEHRAGAVQARQPREGQVRVGQ